MASDIVLGIVTVSMALLGAAVSLHPPESLHKWWVKVCYASAFAILGAIAIVCVVKQSKETATASQDLSNALNNLGKSTAEISRVTTLNTALQQELLGQSDKISTLAEESFENIMGTDSFPYVAPQPAIYPNPIPLFVWDHGQHILNGVSLSIRRTSELNFYQAPIDIGVLHPGWGKPLSVAITPEPQPKTGEDIFTIDMYTQSDYFTEILHFRRSKGGKYWASKFWVDGYKFGPRADSPPPRMKIPKPGKNGSVSFPIYDRSRWSDEPETRSTKDK